MSNSSPYILVLGASIVDIIGFSKGNYHGRDSIPGNIKISLGGVCRNIAENLARVNVNTKFISIIGNDINGNKILKNECTPTYMAILNENGEMESAIVDMESLNKMEFSFIDSKADVIKNAEYVIIGSDNPELVEYLLVNFSNDTKFVLDPVSATKALSIKHLIKYFHTVKPNRIETEALCGFKIENENDLKRAASYLQDLGVKNVFISLDEDGIYYKTITEEGKISTPPIDVKNVTGAGDSFVSGLGYGYMNNLSTVDTVKYAIAMSLITITHEDTINPDMSEDFVKKYMETINWIIK